MEVLFDYGVGEDKEWSPPTFKDCAAADIHKAFLNGNEFAEKRVIRYGEKEYKDILVMLEGPDEVRRTTLAQGWSDRTQGLYKRRLTLYCAAKDLDGKQPEKGTLLRMNAEEGGSFFMALTVVESRIAAGMLTLKLEEVDE